MKKIATTISCLFIVLMLIVLSFFVYNNITNNNNLKIINKQFNITLQKSSKVLGLAKIDESIFVSKVQLKEETYKKTINEFKKEESKYIEYDKKYIKYLNYSFVFDEYSWFDLENDNVECMYQHIYNKETKDGGFTSGFRRCFFVESQDKYFVYLID